MKANGVISLRVVDWNGDQREDLLITSQSAPLLLPGAGVFICLDVGQQREWSPSQPISLLPEYDHRVQTAPDRVTAGVYADLGDVDGDGDLDLVVGGCAEWRTAEPQSGQTSYALAKLKHESAVLAEETARIARASWLATREMTQRQRHEQARKLFLQSPNKQIKQGAARQEMLQRIQRLLPVEHKESFVGLYENVSKQPRK